MEVSGQGGRFDLIEPERKKSLNNYIRRQVRKRPVILEVKKKVSFRVNIKGYLYDKATLRPTTKVNRRRVAVSLTDHNRYNTRLEITLVPESLRMIINVPVYTKIKSHADYNNQIGLALGSKQHNTKWNPILCPCLGLSMPGPFCGKRTFYRQRSEAVLTCIRGWAAYHKV